MGAGPIEQLGRLALALAGACIVFGAAVLALSLLFQVLTFVVAVMVALAQLPLIIWFCTGIAAAFLGGIYARPRLWGLFLYWQTQLHSSPPPLLKGTSGGWPGGNADCPRCGSALGTDPICHMCGWEA